MKLVFRTTAAVFVLWISVLVSASGQELALEAAKFVDDSDLIQNLVLLIDSGSLRFSLTGSGEKGIKHMELLSADMIVYHKECYGTNICRMSGKSVTSQLPSDVITAVVQDNSDRVQREKIKINLNGGATKIYLVSSVPDLASAMSSELAEKPAPEASATGTIATETGAPLEGVKSREIVQAGAKGPVLSVQVKKNETNDYTLLIHAKDDFGVDFIEILENGSFLDVQRCEDKTECTFSKNIKNRKPGRNKYLIKSMNPKNGFSFHEELLLFTE